MGQNVFHVASSSRNAELMFHEIQKQPGASSTTTNGGSSSSGSIGSIGGVDHKGFSALHIAAITGELANLKFITKHMQQKQQQQQQEEEGSHKEAGSEVDERGLAIQDGRALTKEVKAKSEESRARSEEARARSEETRGSPTDSSQEVRGVGLVSSSPSVGSYKDSLERASSLRNRSSLLVKGQQQQQQQNELLALREQIPSDYAGLTPLDWALILGKDQCAEELIRLSHPLPILSSPSSSGSLSVLCPIEYALSNSVYSKMRYHDITIQFTDGQTLKAHKIILSVSPQLVLLLDRFADSSKIVLGETDWKFSSSIFSLLLEFLYTGECKAVSKKEANQLHTVATWYDLPFLEASCQAFLKKTRQPTSTSSYNILASKFRLLPYVGISPLGIHHLHKFVNSSSFHDIVLVFGSHTFYAHRLILFSRSNFFKTLLSKEENLLATRLVLPWVPASSSSLGGPSSPVKLSPDISLAAFRKLLEYWYTNVVSCLLASLSLHGVVELFKMCKLLEEEQLFGRLQLILFQEMNLENLNKVMILAFHPSLNLHGLQALFIEYISRPGVLVSVLPILKKEKDAATAAAYNKLKAKLKPKQKPKKLDVPGKSGRRFFTLAKNTVVATMSEQSLSDTEEVQSYFRKVF
eukprot:TRINITY_DN6951_c0_g1_i3.p1 TRINITY_DN6951_c0_g1~~TRINITY_DN6951_c0_g1_i3.p1  ORF type:complete len:659 (-),score=106.80 TRINITY_DN6951_c0_g1_i3:20-1933(-)